MSTQLLHSSPQQVQQNWICSGMWLAAHCRMPLSINAVCVGMPKMCLSMHYTFKLLHTVVLAHRVRALGVLLQLKPQGRMTVIKPGQFPPRMIVVDGAGSLKTRHRGLQRISSLPRLAQQALHRQARCALCSFSRTSPDLRSMFLLFLRSRQSRAPQS